MSTKKIQIVGGIVPQSDWNQIDETKADYIKNKPFSTETQKIDYVSFFAKDAEPNSEAIWTEAINLVAGHTYSVDIITDTDTTNIQVTAINVSEEFGFDCVMLDYGSSDGNTVFQITDTIDIDSNGEPISGNRAFGFIYNETIKEIRVHKDNVSFLRNNIDPKTNLIWTDTINLIAGNTYSVDMVTDTGTTNLQLTAINAAEGLGFNCVALAYASGEQLLFQIIDTVDSGSGELISGNKTCCGLYNTTIQGVRVYGVSPTVTIVHKLPNKYINLDQTYSPESENAQSGIAVAEAIKKVDQTEKLLLFSRDTISISIINEISKNQIRLTYRIDLERVEINQETNEVTTTPLRTNIPDIQTWYEGGAIIKELLGEITNVKFRVSNDFVGITEPGYSYLDEEEVGQAVTEAGATYKREIFLDPSMVSYNILEARFIASSTDLEVLSAIRDELFTLLKDGTESLALQYKSKPVLEELISEVI